MSFDKGYIGGGDSTNSGAFIATTDKLTYATDTTAAQTTANLSVSRGGLTANSDVTDGKGYFLGGRTGTQRNNQISATTDKCTYSTDTTASQASANLSQARFNSGSVSDNTDGKGYTLGGSSAQNPGTVNTADKTVYSTDTTAAQTTANLSNSRTTRGLSDNPDGKGYIGGGSTGANVNTVDKLVFATDTTAAQTSASLPQAIAGMTTFSDMTLGKGYWLGGTAGSFVKTVTATIFAIETTIAVSSTLITANNGAQSMSDNPHGKGYYLGGLTSSSVVVNTAQRMIFAAGTFAAATTANLSVKRVGAGTLSGNESVIVQPSGYRWGYWCGGNTGSVVNTANKTTFWNDTTFLQSSANLSQARKGLIGISDTADAKGYFLGGDTGATVTTADKITYINDITFAQSSANLSQARNYLAGLSDNVDGKGYFAGGNSSTTNGAQVVAADKIVYSTDTTAAQTSANLSQAREAPSGLSDNVDGKGYFCGGDTSSSSTTVSTADKIVYSTDTTAAQTSANLSQARSASAAIGDNDDGKGYIAGGFSAAAAYVNTADKLTFSNDTTAAQTTANLSQARSGLGGMADNVDSIGYFAGGNTATVSTTYFSTADKLTFSNDTTAAQTTANLSQARSGLGAVSASEAATKFYTPTVTGYRWGYVSGGNTNTIVTTTDKITYSSDTTAADTTANLTTGQAYATGIADSTDGKGYIVGGQTGSFVNAATAQKILFAIDIFASQSSVNLSQARKGVTSVSDNSDGKSYICGGDTGVTVPVSTADKLTFSNDTTAAQTTANLSQARTNAAGSSDNNDGKGYICGGNTGAVVSTADEITYSNDTTAAQTTANLSQARQQLKGLSDNNGGKGYFCGGNTGVAVTTTDEIWYATDTTIAQTSANLSQARYDVAKLSDNTDGKGYIAGGTTTTNSFVVTTDKLVFSTDTMAAQNSANLTVAREAPSGISGSEVATFFTILVATGYRWGYFCGGSTGTLVTTTDKITYATNTTQSSTAASLTTAQSYGTGISDTTDGKGYIVGGQTGSFVDAVTAQKITYSNDTFVAQTTANLSQARQGLTSVSDNTDGKGYFCGGDTGATVPVSTADKIVYSTDTTAAQTTANLSQSRTNAAGISDDTDGKGYILGGSTGTVVSTTDKIVYSTDTTAAQTTANLSQARQQSEGLTDNTDGKGYVTGGTTGAAVATTDKIFYDTDIAVAQASANLSQARYFSAGVSDNTNGVGYIAGGTTTTGSYVATADKINYITDTTASQSSANLSQSRESSSGLSAAEASTAFFILPVAGYRWGYVSGGYTGALVTTTDKLTYSSDTTAADATANLATAQTYGAGMSDTTDGKGYVVGGQTGSSVVTATAQKITYSSDTFVAQTTANLSQAREHLAAVADNAGGKGYFFGGDTLVAVTTADKITFSNDTTAAQTTANLIQGITNLAGASDNTDGKGYIGGGGQLRVSKVNYSTDTTVTQTTANLSQARQNLTAVSDNTDSKGYFVGGNTSVAVTTADKIFYSTDTTVAQTSANLSQARLKLGGLSDNFGGNGYFTGGSSATAAYVNTADKLIFSTDTTAAQTTANLSQAREGISTISGTESATSTIVTSVYTYLLLLGIG